MRPIKGVNFAYTASVKRLSTLLLTIVLAVIAGAIVASNQTKAHIDRLIASPSVTDQLQGIALLQDVSFDELIQQLKPILDDDSAASIKAQELLVKVAFQENRIDDLDNLSIDDELFEAAMWWNSPRSTRIPFPLIVIKSGNPSPWVWKLISHYDFHSSSYSDHATAPYPDLTQLPLRDRDGSILLSVLAIKEHAPPHKIEQLVEAWSYDYDLDRQKAAVLLSAIRNLPSPNVSQQNESIATLQAIINEKNTALAWRALHLEDGSINPDTALAAMIIDPETFAPILIETAKNGKWTHPEHAVLIAESFLPTITNELPHQLLWNSETRQKWWSLVACGLLLEER